MEEGAESNKSDSSLHTSGQSIRSIKGAGIGPPRSSSLPKNTSQETTGKFSASGLANWAKNLRINPNTSQDAQNLKSPLSFFSTGFGKKSPSKIPVVEVPLEGTTNSSSPKDGTLGTFTRGFIDTSKNAVKAVQIKARHIVSQNKRRYQEGGFDLDMSYITENIIAMGFPAGDMSSGFLGYVEGFYRNHMEEVIKFFECRHKGKYKVYNLCSERLYDASLFEGKVACFPFDDHNCPPLQLVAAFCQSAYAWLKGDLENVVVVHCKAGMARTGLMISSLLLYLKFFPTAEESIAYYNQKRCVDGKGLVLPSQVRYVKYFERVLRNCDGETPTGRTVVLRGFRLHKCPYWIRPSITLSDHNGILFSTKKHPRTKDLMPEDYWFSAPRKGVMVFALPGERGLTDLNGDFKIHFHDRHGDFYCWLNTNMMENRTLLTPQELDGFDKRKLPSPGFQVEVVILDNDSHMPPKKSSDGVALVQQDLSDPGPMATVKEKSSPENATEVTQPPASERDEIFSDSEGEESNESSSIRHRGREGFTKHDIKESQSSWISTEHVTTTEGGLSSAMPAIEGTDCSVIDARDTGTAFLRNSDSPIHDISRMSVGQVEHVDESVESQLKVEGREEESTTSCPRKEKHEQASGKVKLDAALNASDFKAIAAASAADASVFTFGDDEDYESDM